MARSSSTGTRWIRRDTRTWCSPRSRRTRPPRLADRVLQKKRPARASTPGVFFFCGTPGLLLVLRRIEILAGVVLELGLHSIEHVLGRGREVRVSRDDAHRDARLH